VNHVSYIPVGLEHSTDSLLIWSANCKQELSLNVINGVD